VWQLVYKLEHAADSKMDKDWFKMNTEKFTDGTLGQVCASSQHLFVQKGEDFSLGILLRYL